MGVSIGALVPLVANLGLLAILAWVYSVFSVRISRLLSVSVAPTAISMPVVFVLPPDLWAVVVTKIWPQLLGANLIGTAILGSLVRREDARVRLQLQMAEQERLARAGTAAKSRFLPSVSHEIRTPLNAILGVMQLMERQELPRQAKDDLRAAREAGIFLVGLINQVLDFAKIEGGVVNLNPERFSLGALTSNLQSIFAGQAQKKGLRLEFVSVKEADGFEATKLILGSNPSIPKPPIFALTANVMREQVDEYKRAGMKGVIGKPFRRSEIQALSAELGGNESCAF